MDSQQDSKPAKARKGQPLKKLTRQQITEGLDQFPVEVLLSSGKGKKPALTTKQKEFARNLAMGKTKAQAYRDSYNSNPAPSTIVHTPYILAADPRIQSEVEAYKLAIEAEKHRTPLQLKALLVQQLVQHSLDSEFPPAQRVQCLKLLGSLFEVGAFVERKEVTTVSRSGDIRQRILETLKDVTDVQEVDSGLSLLEELGQGKHSDTQASDYEGNTIDAEGAAKHGETPDDGDQDVILSHDDASSPEQTPSESSRPDPTAPPPDASARPDGAEHTHSIPDERTDKKSEDPPLLDGSEKGVGV